MATALKRSGPRSWAAERELIELAKTMYLEAIVKRLDASRIIKTAKRLGLSIKGRKAKKVVGIEPKHVRTTHNSKVDA
jgi:hypothetical protein